MSFINNLIPWVAALLFIAHTPVASAASITLEKMPKIKGIARHVGAGDGLYAATNRGLYVSLDNGQSWDPVYPDRLPATMVSAGGDGTLYAFVAGKGLLRMHGSANTWVPINNDFGSQVLIQVTSGVNEPDRLVAINQFGRVILSSDGGVSWRRAGGGSKPLNDAGERGRKLYVARCQSCHGKEGVGESYSMESLTNKKYIIAPALDDSTHAWHHTDDALVKTILNGSPRTKRMPSWKDAGLTEQDARDVVVYMKSLWGARALACQGPKHMNCN